MDLNSIPRMILSLTGSALLGVGVGHLGSMVLPGFNLEDDAVSSVTGGLNGATMLGKALINSLSRLITEITVLAQGSQLLMKELEGSDPTNGGVALITLILSDPKLQHDFRLLNSLIHLMLTKGLSLDKIESYLKAKEDVIMDKVTQVIQSQLPGK